MIKKAFGKYLAETLGVLSQNLSVALGMNKAFNTKWSTVKSTLFTAVHMGYSGKFSKMLQDVMGYSLQMSTQQGNIASLGACYIVSKGSGFSAGSGMSQYAKLRQGSLTAFNNGFNIKDETSGVTTLKGAMAVMDIVETATTNLDQIRAEKRMW